MTTKSAADVEREVEASREELERTVEALKEKMTPGEIFREARGAMGGAGNKMMMKVVEQARDNPIPVALIGLGVAWLAVSQTRRSHAYEGAYAVDYGGGTATSADYYGDAARGPSLKEKVSDRAHAVAEKASDMVASARERVHGAASGARDQTRSAMGNVSQVAGQVRDRAGQVGQRVKRQAVDTFESEPLLLGALGLVVGVAIGAAMPTTAAEARYMGPTRDRLLGKGRDLARTRVDQVKGAAQNAYGRVKEELQRSDEGGDLATRVGAAATAGVQAVREGVQDQGVGSSGTTTH